MEDGTTVVLQEYHGSVRLSKTLDEASYEASYKVAALSSFLMKIFLI